MHIGKRFVYPHNDIDKLRNQLERANKIVKDWIVEEAPPEPEPEPVPEAEEDDGKKKKKKK